MRLFLILAGILASISLFAQKKQVQNVPSNTQNEPPAQQTVQPNCFEKNYDSGLSNIRRGDYRNALHILEDAKDCPDAQVSPRRMSELESLIDFCNRKLNLVSHEKAESAVRKPQSRVTTLDATTPEFVISPALRNNTDPNCYRLTVREADRAFRDSAWEAAAKLYRAAKNCEDANQTDRERMNTRIAECEAAAKDVLLQKEQKAVRLARHSMASNLAAQAMSLLRQGNRSLAFRLADFANFYIAPDDNPDCLEAMYAAFFNAQVRIEGQAQQLPFCYQLSDELGQNVQLQFVNIKNRLYLKAYQPDIGGIYTWELPSMKFVEGYSSSVLQNPRGFDIAPDGSFLYYGDNKFYLENGQLYIDVPAHGKYCFSEENDFFFYQDVKENIIRAVPLSTAASYVQFRKNGNISRSGQQAFSMTCGENLLAICARNDQIWMGYPDRIEVYERPTKDGEIKPVMVWRFQNAKPEENMSMKLFPQRREAVVAGDSSFSYYFLHLPVSGEDTVDVEGDQYHGFLFACTPGADTLITFSETGFENGDLELTLASPGAKQMLQRFVYQDQDGIKVNNAALSPDGDWLATVENGAVRVMPTGDKFSTQAAVFESNYTDKLSANGDRLISANGNVLHVYDASQMSKPPSMFRVPEGGIYLPRGESKEWLVYQSSPGQLELVRGDKKMHIPCKEADYNFHCFAFDNTEQKYIACSSGAEVTVYSLTDGAVIARRTFPGDVSNLQSIPGTDNLLVAHANRNAMSDNAIKVWNISDANSVPEPVHLEGYHALEIAVSEQGDHVAFTDGLDVHVFATGNWMNEVLVINPGNGLSLGKIRFRPDGAALAGGCNDGEVFIWDIYSGQPILKFLNSWNGLPYPIFDLAFAAETGDLHLLSQGVLFTVPVDASILHDYVLTEDRWLKTFSSGQIREYGLETAFKYPGNLDRLAQSGDQLLIRSFLQFFQEQSKKSYNLAQVSTYCTQASTFLEALGKSANLQAILLEMYRDLINKCLVRNDLKEAHKQLIIFARRFGPSPVFNLLQAHLALLEGKTEDATRLYSNYLISTYQDDKFDENINEIEERMGQFQDANLLDSVRLACVCSVFQPFFTNNVLCNEVHGAPTNSIAEQAARYKAILLAVNDADYITSYGEKVKALEAARAEAAKLDYPNPLVKVHPLEFATTALADAYVQQAFFEHNSPKTPLIFEKAVQLLEKTGPFKNSSDTTRLARLAGAELQWGNYLLLCSRIAEAESHLNSGIAYAQKLVAMAGDESVQAMEFNYRYLGPLLAALCEARLLEGNVAGARSVLEQATDLLSADVENTLSGRAALLEKDETQAFLDFGSLKTAPEIGPGIYNVRRMAEQLPADRDYLNGMIAKLKDTYMSIHPQLREPQIDYYESILQVEHFAAMMRFDSALTWATRARTLAQALLDQSNNNDSLRTFFLAQCLNESYYRVMVFHADTSQLSSTIRLIESAFPQVNSENLTDTYYETLLYTNLAHAYWLRGQGDDRLQAVAYYKKYLALYDWEILRKDFIDLHRGGVNWPDLKDLLQQILPNLDMLSTEDKSEMGL